jgi:hypothetical protein
VRIGLDPGRVESSLKEVADEVIPTVERLGVDAVQLLEPAREGGSTDLNDQVVVVRHEAIRVDDPRSLRTDGFQKCEETQVIVVDREDGLSSVAS